jgi:parallel beta-helix repeat protein
MFGPTSKGQQLTTIRDVGMIIWSTTFRGIAMLRAGVVALSLLAFGSVGAGAASAATLTVDNDKVQCPTAGFTKISAAINAAAAGDTINVCPGGYYEQVYMPKTKPGLVVQATQSRLASILAPPQFPFTGAYDTLQAMVILAGDHDVVRGFRILGPLPPNPQPCGTEGFSHNIGVQIGGNYSLLEDNQIRDIRDNCNIGGGVWVGDAQNEMGIELGGAGSIVRDNLIEQYRDFGVVVETGQPRVQILDNDIIGAQSRPNVGIIGGQEGSLDIEGNLVNGNLTKGISLKGVFTEESHIVRSNQIRGNGIGIDTGSFSGGPALIVANTITASRSHAIVTDGIGGPDGAIRDNVITDNGGDGLHVVSGGGPISNNQLLRNRGDGIHIEGQGYVIDHNTATGNLGRDCRDLGGTGGSGTSGTFNTWTLNKGKTSAPAGLCTP